ncbi:methyltransferase family protein [Georgenia soli]|uniref:Methyltransferase family protein n=1 Tax=Georgenia soli TaxID=638953 RepID=A0A2A9EKC8_9MICO|nr:class I SAM-dependent methyltransferase [Georgenia soli]PFG39263.1 methyltransferase family protein [Georgenia soli]
MDPAAWDARYGEAGRVWSAEPSRFLVETFSALPAGSVLDVGTGEGRHATWLASRGWTVTAVDFSAEAIRKARELQRDHAPATVGRIEWVRADVVAEPPRPAAYDAVVVLYLHLPAQHRRQVLRGAAEALAPGGTLLVVGHDSANLAEGVGGPQDPAVLFTAGDVVEDLAGAHVRILRAERVARPVGDDGAAALDAVVVARRP